METLYGQATERKYNNLVLHGYTVSPDKKYILYRCIDWSNVKEDYKEEFYALYDIKEKSFRILYEQILSTPSGLPPVQVFANLLWKDKDTVIINKADKQTWCSQKIDIKTQTATQFSDSVVMDITDDGQHWISEFMVDRETKTVTTVLCAKDGSEYELYEAKRGSGSYRFLDNRYLEVKSPDDYTIIDNNFYLYTLRLYDLETMSYYKIEFMKPIFEQYGEDTQLKLFDDTIEGNKVLFTFAGWYIINENEKRNSVQFEVELLPESSMALDAPSS